MLIQFAVENYLSFHEKTVFSMRAAPNVERGPEAAELVRGTEILRCAALFGANASGKSNFVKALEFMREMVLTGVEEGRKIRVRPFQLRRETREAPGVFEVYLRAATGKTYVYGFSCGGQAVVREWLSEVGEIGEIGVFTREGKSFEFGFEGEVLAFLRAVLPAVRDNQLFLRTAKALNIQGFPAAIREVVAWFDELIIVGPEARYTELVSEIEVNAEFRGLVGEVLAKADTGISGLRTEQRLISDDERAEIERMLSRREADSEAVHLRRGRQRAVVKREGADWAHEVTLRFTHAAQNGETMDFGMEEESDGTLRLLDLVPLLYLARSAPRVFVVDELDRSMHTLLTRWLIERFIRDEPGVQCQLIFTSHDTNLLNLQELRPDMDWFVQKDRAGASALYSLAEFKQEQLEQLRSDLEKAYLRGRFGGIPDLPRGAWR